MENGKTTRCMVSSETRENESLGRGVLTLPGGVAYDGEWKDGKPDSKFRDARE